MRSIRPPPKVNPPRMAEFQRLGYPSEYAWAQDQGHLEIKGSSSSSSNKAPPAASTHEYVVDPDMYATREREKGFGHSGAGHGGSDMGGRFESSPRDYGHGNSHQRNGNGNGNGGGAATDQNFDFEDAVRQEMAKIQRSIIEFATPSKADQPAVDSISNRIIEPNPAPVLNSVRNSVSFKDSEIDDRNSRVSPRDKNYDNSPRGGGGYYQDNNNNNYNQSSSSNNNNSIPTYASKARVDDDRASLMLGDMYKSADELKRDRRRQQQEYFHQLQTDPAGRVNQQQPLTLPEQQGRENGNGNANVSVNKNAIGSNPNQLRNKGGDKDFLRQQQEEYRRQLDQDQLSVDPLGGLRTNFNSRKSLPAGDSRVGHPQNQYQNHEDVDANYSHGNGRPGYDSSRDPGQQDASHAISHGQGLRQGGQQRDAVVPPSYRSVEEEKKELLRQQREEYRRQLDFQRQEKEVIKKKQTVDDQIPIYNGHFPTKEEKAFNQRHLQVQTKDDESDMREEGGNHINHNNRVGGATGHSNLMLNQYNGQPASTSNRSPSNKSRSEAHQRKVQEVYGRTEVISPDHNAIAHDPNAVAFENMSMEEAKKEKARLKHIEYSKLLDEQRRQKEQIKKQEKDLDMLPIYNGKFLVKDSNAPKQTNIANTNTSQNRGGCISDLSARRARFEQEPERGSYLDPNSIPNSNPNLNSYYESNYDAGSSPEHGNRGNFNPRQSYDPYEPDNFNGNNNNNNNIINNNNSSSSGNNDANSSHYSNNGSNPSPKRAARNRKVQEVYGKTELVGANESFVEVQSQEEAKKEAQRKQHEEYRKQLDVQKAEIEAAKRKAKLDKEKQDRDDRDREDQFYKVSNKRVSMHRQKGDQFKESHELEVMKHQPESVGHEIPASQSFKSYNNNSNSNRNNNNSRKDDPTFVSPSKARERKLQEIYGKTNFTSHNQGEESLGGNESFNNGRTHDTDHESAPANAQARQDHLRDMAVKAATHSSSSIGVGKDVNQNNGRVGAVKAAPPAKRVVLDENPETNSSQQRHHQQQQQQQQQQRHHSNREADYAMNSARGSAADYSFEDRDDNHRRFEKGKGLSHPNTNSNPRHSLGQYDGRDVNESHTDNRLSDSFRREIDYSRLRQSLQNERALNDFDLSQRANDLDQTSASSALNMSYRPTSADETDLLLMQWQMKQQKQGIGIRSDMNTKGGINDFPVIRSHENFNGGVIPPSFQHQSLGLDEDVSLVSDTRFVPADPWGPGGLLNLLGAQKASKAPRNQVNHADMNESHLSSGGRGSYRLDQSLVSESYMVYMNASQQTGNTPLKASFEGTGGSMTATNNVAHNSKASSPLSAVIKDANAFLRSENSIRSNPNSRPGTANSSHSNTTSATQSQASASKSNNAAGSRTSGKMAPSGVLANDSSAPDLVSDRQQQQQQRGDSDRLLDTSSSGLQEAGLSVITANSNIYSKAAYTEMSLNGSMVGGKDTDNSYVQSSPKSPKAKGGINSPSLSINNKQHDYSNEADLYDQHENSMPISRLTDAKLIHNNSNDDDGELHIIPSSSSKISPMAGTGKRNDNSHRKKSADSHGSRSGSRSHHKDEVDVDNTFVANNDNQYDEQFETGHYSGNFENDIENYQDHHGQDGGNDYGNDNEIYDDDEGQGAFGDLIISGKGFGSPTPQVNNNMNNNKNNSNNNNNNSGVKSRQDVYDGDDAELDDNQDDDIRGRADKGARGGRWDTSPTTQNKVLSELNKLNGGNGNGATSSFENSYGDDDFEK